MLNNDGPWQPSWMVLGENEHNFYRGPSKDRFNKVWLKLASWFQTS